ncbi:Mrp/NBP35 family ATP-binding protein [Natranaeroarchaeum aerophilus]|uniref:Iron-sulfur cluster carrier protein n=1 Tax=Natranaeroarchaeum aerophilus TaxID=2917711 RepID=A0AAE3K6C5_9EURY|nr:Mrp/NBP35 family ATP-binding protein [Natranaeroarchaeum aerophilus]MCL9814858.1 Mrp/NBP35 family ATP-binding protein [Natranaeroarchaeum aerophilus]
MTSERELLDRLGTVTDPQLDDDIVSLGLINEVTVDDGTAYVSLALNTPYAPGEMELGERIRDAIAELGLEPQLQADVDESVGFDTEVYPDIKNVIAVASGKGGVGKTTVATNLAAGLNDLGARVGILDADIHGPNVPRILNVEDEPSLTDDQRLIPPSSDGISVISMRFLTENEDDPAVLRGPMVNNVLMQFVEDVEWGRLDYLIVDLPPGTGDASLNLLQSVPVTGAVIVTTPQQMAVDDARKGLELFAQHDTEVLGVVENMSAFQCPNCDDTHEVFGRDGADGIVEDYGVDLLGRLPVHPDLGAEGTGRPAVTDTESAVAEPLTELVETVADRVGEVNRATVGDHRAEPDDADWLDDGA